MPDPKTLEALLTKGNDSALLRFSLGDAYLRKGNPEKAVEHLAIAVELDAGYSAGLIVRDSCQLARDSGGCWGAA